MPEETFRIVVTAAVVLAAIAFVVQACVVLALYRASRKMQEKTSQLMNEVRPVIAKVSPTLEKVQPLIDRIGPVLDNAGPVMQKAGAMIDKAGPAFERMGPMADKIAALAEAATAVTASTRRAVEEVGPHITGVSDEAKALIRTGREQVERFGNLVNEAGEVARGRLEKIDQAVDNTVEQVENVSGAVKRAMLRPVREVNGLAAGITAAVNALVRGQRKSSVDSATQDEEMFI